MYFCRLHNERKREEVNKTTAFLAVIWVKNWNLMECIKEKLDVVLVSTEYRSSASHINSPKSTLTA